TPTSIDFDCTTRLPISFAAAVGFSASASASARVAYRPGPGLGSRDCRSCKTGSRFTDEPTVESGRVQLRRIASATPSRIAEASFGDWFWILCKNFSRSLIVTRLPARVPVIPARSAVVNCSSAIRARTRGETKLAPFNVAGTGKPPLTGEPLEGAY